MHRWTMQQKQHKTHTRADLCDMYINNLISAFEVLEALCKIHMRCKANGKLRKRMISQYAYIIFIMRLLVLGSSSNISLRKTDKFLFLDVLAN